MSLLDVLLNRSNRKLRSNNVLKGFQCEIIRTSVIYKGPNFYMNYGSYFVTILVCW